MSDISTIWNVDESVGDWEQEGAMLQSGDDLVTAIYISLFTDRTARADDEIPDGTENRRGWWGDVDQKYPLGSRLWLLARAKQTNETLLKARDYINEALKWMIDDGVVVKFNVRTEWTRTGMLGAKITAFKKDGSTESKQFEWAWKEIG